MTASINDLPPPYPNQALLRSREISEVSPQKLVREKAEEAQDIAARIAADHADGEAGGAGTGQNDTGKDPSFSLYV